MAVSNLVAVNLDATYAWDNEGRLTSRTYPGNQWNGGPVYGYQYDVMGRMNGIMEGYTQRATAAYGPASEMTNLSYYGYSETRTYNNLLQLTRQTIPNVLDLEYVFPAGQNNGRISSQIDHLSGEQVNYTYDALQRLVTAATVGPQWGQSYTYDGFGNLTAEIVTQGSGSNMNQSYDPATNHMIGRSYDANGDDMGPGVPNWCDEENKLSGQYDSSAGTIGWWYDPSGKRVMRCFVDSQGNLFWRQANSGRRRGRDDEPARDGARELQRRALLVPAVRRRADVDHERPDEIRNLLP